jgi:predicted amidohydrolase YtcJ
MVLQRHFVVAALLLLSRATTCHSVNSVAAAGDDADFVLHTGRIWTGDPHRPWAESLAAREGVIVAVGSRADVEKLRGSKTKVLDAPGSFATPGLIDAHGHLSSLGETQEQVDLRDATSIEEVVRRVVKRADGLPHGAWVTGRSWDQSLWPGKELPTHEPLTRVMPDRPVFLRRVDGHAVWVNAAAMKIAGVTVETKDPPGGKLLRDRSGNPTGVLLDAAVGIVSKHISAPGRDGARRQFLAAQKLCLESGLTGVHDAGLSRREIEVLRELDASGELKLRVYGMASPPGGREVEFVSTPPPAAKPNDRFRLRAIKMFIDGAMGSRGGALFEDYSDDPGNRGLILTEPARLERITETALRNGWQVCTHAIGDRGNRLVLDAYESALNKVPPADRAVSDPRLRIEHAQLVALEDIPRFARLGVVASMQPTHATTDMRWAEDRVGPKRITGAYAWRRFLDAKGRLAFGSDFPVEQVSPLLGLYAAVTRQDLNGHPADGWLPDQRLTIDEALRAFTGGSAYASFDETHLGVLRPGMLCDVTVFDLDLFDQSTTRIARAKVFATVVAGEVIWGSSD